MRFRLNSLVIFSLCCLAHDSCADTGTTAVRLDTATRGSVEADQNGPAIIEADSLSGKKDDQIEATGNATLRQNGQSISADRFLYQQRSQDLDARGSVILKQDGNTMSGPHLLFNLGNSAGRMEQPQFYLEANEARGSADALRIQDREHFSLDNATYTTCPAGNDDWMMKMGMLELDRDRMIGVARHATVEFKGVPILYTPWMDFPLNDQRKSGFLAPVFGGTSQGGTEVTLPYYWNIAANQDATFAPRIMLKRGLMLNNEYRYLGRDYGGELHVDVLPNDKVADRDRARFALKHDQMLADGFAGFVNYNRVADDAYFRDLGNAVNATSQANLLQEGGLKFNSGSWNAVARVQRYQTLQDPAAPIAVPYARLPQVTLDAQQSVSAATFNLAGEFVSFSHPTAVNGRRLVIYPSISYPLLDDSAVYITPKVALHGTKYVMGANNVTALQNAARVLPVYSIDSGIAFERDSNMFGGDYLQTFEPRVFYVYVPYRNQDLLPNFDTAQADFSFTQMFTENRFFGSDRFGDADHVTLAMTSRLLERVNGMERLKVTVGERFSFKTPRVNLITPTTTINKSDILLAAAGRITDAWSVDSEFQFDPNQSHAQRYNIAARYRPEAGKVFNLGYRFMRNALRQVDVSSQWPLTGRWHAVGRWDYSLQDDRTLEAIAGLEYNQSCWTLRLVAQHFATATQQSNTGFFVQLELNDFIKVGADPLSLLKQSVPGYAKTNVKSAEKTTQPLP
ncbi:MAG: organic solvent tolerance protein [Gallionellales bacterium RIFCSPLOWO2_02_FULL_57_47]|nr:MAG: organic solvent tolerance protein [Gallionellales bacterium RIFCSPLOWO2_02_FULL_57_47]OGT07539.1 MAG: organic solvent tolerance protein [Gallionellales bacterium RIFCSPHIGHO2_02_FULL_57_16]